MKTQHEMATLLIRSALARGLSKNSAIEITKSVLSAFDLPAYSWSQEQALYDDLKSACLFQPLAALTKTLKEADDAARVGGATAAFVGPPRGRVGGATASVNARPAADPGRGVTPVATNPAASCFAPSTLQALALLKDVAKEAQKKKPVPRPKTSNLTSSIQLGGHVSKLGGNEVTITKHTPLALELRVIGRGRA